MVENRDTKILEAILFASGEPVLEEDLKQKITDNFTSIRRNCMVAWGRVGGLPPISLNIGHFLSILRIL